MATHTPRIDKSLLASRFGSRVGSYDAVTPVQAEMANRLVSLALDHFKSRPVSRILELGCGTGRMTHHLTTAFPKARITALDISDDMIRFAKSRNPSVNYIVADAEAFLRDTPNRYDLIISNAAMQWFEDADAALNNAYNQLTPGGLITVSTFGDRTFNELNQAFRHAYAAAGTPAVPHAVPMRTSENWRNAFPEAELSEQIQVRHFPDVRRFLRSVQEAGAVNSMSGRHFLGRRVLDEMIQYYTAHYADATAGHISATYHVIYLKYCKK